jgi:hypothetical protein
MTITLLSILEAVLLVGGAFGAFFGSRLVSRSQDRRATLMGSVAAWLILFGILPFFAFALLVERVTPEPGGPAGWEEFVLNVLPFALIVSPLAGFIHGVKLSEGTVTK